MKQFINSILSVLHTTRRVGQTTTLAGVAKMNPKAVIIVGNHQMKHMLAKDHNLPKQQVHSIYDFPNLMGGNLGPLLFDTTALTHLLGGVSHEMDLQERQIRQMKKDMEFQAQMMEIMKTYQIKLEDTLTNHGISI